MILPSSTEQVCQPKARVIEGLGNVPYAVGAMLAISAIASKVLTIECDWDSNMFNSHRQTKNKPQIATSNMYMVPAFPPLDNVSTTLLGRSSCQHTHIATESPKGDELSERAHIKANSHEHPKIIA